MPDPVYVRPRMSGLPGPSGDRATRQLASPCPTSPRLAVSYPLSMGNRRTESSGGPPTLPLDSLTRWRRDVSRVSCRWRQAVPAVLEADRRVLALAAVSLLAPSLRRR